MWLFFLKWDWLLCRVSLWFDFWKTFITVKIYNSVHGILHLPLYWKYGPMLRIMMSVCSCSCPNSMILSNALFSSYHFFWLAGFWSGNCKTNEQQNPLAVYNDNIIKTHCQKKAKEVSQLPVCFINCPYFSVYIKGLT